ncbi:MAG: disulfide oxidoreductase [Candidatus Aenigmatarchaeota archaeon]|nr:MAG: disulfide oxidoreductase [Candidatus Aenigmarchaeota archaeon]
MAGKITKDMALRELVVKYPQAAEIMMKSGLHCIGCHMAAMETVEQGAKAHGMSDRDIEKMIKEMNEAVSKD